MEKPTTCWIETTRISLVRDINPLIPYDIKSALVGTLGAKPEIFGPKSLPWRQGYPILLISSSKRRKEPTGCRIRSARISLARGNKPIMIRGKSPTGFWIETTRILLARVTSQRLVGGKPTCCQIGTGRILLARGKEQEYPCRTYDLLD